MMIIGLLLFLPVCYLLLKAIYNLYLHPLHNIPGPKSWIAFPVLRHVSALRGNLDRDISRFHATYGEILRYSDIEVSFTTAQAWNDIYGHGRSHEKYNNREPGSTPDITMSSDADHSRFRRVLAHAFSEKGLRDQEPLITQYIDELILVLKDEATKQKTVDMTMLYNLTTFDIISDLCFGKTFKCLENRCYNEYIDAVFDFVQLAPFVRVQKDFATLWNWTLGLFLNRGIKTGRSKLRTLSKEVAMARIYEEGDHTRADFMDTMMRHRGSKNGLSDDEIAANANILFIAGSETTATLLAGVTFWLTQTPSALRQVTEEVRSAFGREEEITFHNTTQNLPYMLACLDEAFRKYPPVPFALPRIVAKPTTISGYEIPAHTLVGVHQKSSYETERNWHRADEYLPERWLPEVKTDSSSPFYKDNREVLRPFSVGPRNCIGRNLAYNEMRLILAKILWNFDLSAPEANPNWVKDQKTMLLWVKAPLWCKLSLRNDLPEKI